MGHGTFTGRTFTNGTLTGSTFTTGGLTTSTFTSGVAAWLLGLWRGGRHNLVMGRRKFDPASVRLGRACRIPGIEYSDERLL